MIDGSEVEPRREPVQGVAAGRLGEGELLIDPVERVAAIHDPVGPRSQSGAAESGPYFVGVERDDEVPSAVFEGAESGAERGDRCVIVARGQAEMCSGDGGGHGAILSKKRGEYCRGMKDDRYPDTLGGDESIILAEFDTPPSDPLRLLCDWLAGAVAGGIREPLAASLATVGPAADGGGLALPSTRVILVKAFDENGLTFGTNASSRKGRDLAATPYAALGFYWRETMQQLRVEGPVRRLGVEESVAMFTDRPRAAQVTTAVSRQGETLIDEGALAAEAAALAAETGDISVPGEWAAYRLEPIAIEFWHGRSNRLHRRLAYRRVDLSSAWTHTRLQP